MVRHANKLFQCGRIAHATLALLLLCGLLWSACGGPNRNQPPNESTATITAGETKDKSPQQLAHEQGCFERWGITDPGETCVAHEAELSKAHVLFYGMAFNRARLVYERILDECPWCVDAHVGLSMTYRYLGSDENAFRHARIAVGLDSLATIALWNCGELLWPWRGKEYDEFPHLIDRLEQSRNYLQRAAATSHPGAAHALISLWTFHAVTQEPELARVQLQEMGRRNYFPAVVTDRAYNYLAGLDSNAVLLTVGDMDTYPVYYLQEVEEVRTDVAVVNAAMLGMWDYAKKIRDDGKAPITLTDMEIDLRITGQEVLHNLVDNTRAAKRPLYATGTIPWLDGACFPVQEGMVMRLLDTLPDDNMDLPKIVYNFDSVYRPIETRLPGVEWNKNISPTTRQMPDFFLQYARLCGIAAEWLYDRQDRERCVRFCRKAHAIFSSFKQDDATIYTLRLWRSARPSDKEPGRLWEDRFGGFEPVPAGGDDI